MAKSSKAKDKAAQAPHDAEPRSYTVLARRYRPKQFDDCIGQEHVVRALKNAIETNRIAHAYLFTGVRGVGKTSMARIFAKALNCEKGPTTAPCDQCDICRCVSTGDDIDVIEIDAASNRGIDDVRSLRQAVQYRPSRARFRIYILDEAHMITPEAFNALLKTLEEPPPHVKFIFCTTVPEKLPITILSRCQRFDFAGVELERIIERLKEIVAAEGRQADDEAMEMIARRAAGSMRDSQSLLDQLLAFGGECVTAADVHGLLGSASDEQVIHLSRAIFGGDAADCLARVEAAVAAGVQLGEWIDQLIAYFRDLLVLCVLPNAALISMPNRMRDEMLARAASVSPERILEMMDLLASCRGRMKALTFGRTLLEMTLVRLCRLDQFLDLASSLPDGPESPGAVNRRGEPAAASSRSTTGRGGPGNSGAAATRAAQPPSGDPSSAAQDVHADERATNGTVVDPMRTAEFWQAVLGQISDSVTVSFLKLASTVEFQTPNAIVLQFAPKSAHAIEYCGEPVRLQCIEAAVSATAGRPMRCVLHSIKESQGDALSRPPVETPATLRDLANRNPLVRKAEDVFGARVLAVDRVLRTDSLGPKVEPEEVD